MLLIGVAAFAPVAALTWDVDARAIPYIAASAALELGYFAFLAAAYRAADVGLVYPIARGSAPVLALLGAVVIMGQSTSTGQILGVVAVTMGILLVCGVGIADASSDRRGVLLALATAGFIAGYTLVDKEGLQHAAAIPYIELVLFGPGARLRRGRPRDEGRRRAPRRGDAPARPGRATSVRDVRARPARAPRGARGERLRRARDERRHRDSACRPDGAPAAAGRPARRSVPRRARCRTRRLGRLVTSFRSRASTTIEATRRARAPAPTRRPRPTTSGRSRPLRRATRRRPGRGTRLSDRRTSR